MEALLKKYARLAIHNGVNLQRNQTLLVKASVETVDFTRAVVKEAYVAGAKEVVVTYIDDINTKYNYLYQSDETLQEVHNWQIDCNLDYFKEGACILHITSPIPGILKECEPKKMALRQRAMAERSKEVRAYTTASMVQWSIISVPNPTWASMVFPDLSVEDAMQELWKQIFACVYVDETCDPVETWKQRDVAFQSRIKKMNEFAFESLHFTSDNGTDLVVGLVDHHLWGGGSENSQAGITFNANIPTEEIFTMPHKNKVDGRVVASRPLLYNGNLIKDFYLDFKDGKVVAYDAKEGKAVLQQLIEFDEGSSRLGEVALVPYDSPISQSGTLFLTTLFDENASCHLALGETYPTCVENGVNLSEKELAAIGGNTSMVHVDFMFGTKDMKIIGTCADGKTYPVFENGNFVI